MKNFFNQILSFFNLRLENKNYFKATYASLLESKDSPLSLDYVKSREGVIANLTLSKGRGLPLYSFGVNGSHPFIAAISRSLEVNKELRLSIMQEFLRNYYLHSIPKNVNDIYDIKFANHVFGNSLPWTIVMPWENHTHKSWASLVKSSVISENKCCKSKLDIRGGWAWTGPTSEKKCNIESVRTYNLLISILANGYKSKDEHDGYIRSYILFDTDSNWCWQSISAQHRALVLSALDYKSVDVKITKFIRRSEAKFWPNVLNKLYTENEALEVFDKIMDNYSPHFLETS